MKCDIVSRQLSISSVHYALSAWNGWACQKDHRQSMFIVLDERPTFIKEIHFANDANDVALGILFLLRMPYVLV